MSDGNAATWVKDITWYPSQETKLLKDGRLKMTVKVADNEELVDWILSFGDEVRIIEPEGLRQKARESNPKTRLRLGRYRQT